MSDDEAQIDVRVTRYDVQRMRIFQAMIPFAIIVTTVARYFPTPTMIAGTVLIQVAALGTLLSGVKRVGWQPLVFDGGGVAFGSSGFGINRQQMRDWTRVGRVVRLYSSRVSYKLLAREGSELVLAAVLQGQFGRPIPLERRGSRPARTVALGAALLGVTLVALAIANESTAFAIPGGPLLVIGIATFGALSQRAAKR